MIYWRKVSVFGYPDDRQEVLVWYAGQVCDAVYCREEHAAFWSVHDKAATWLRVHEDDVHYWTEKNAPWVR